MAHRRDFIRNVTLASLSFTQISAFLKGCGDGKIDLSNCLEDEFHYFDNNLTNLHFYFLNAKITAKKLVPCNSQDAFMIVKIPQQHISEQLLRESDFDAAYSTTNRLTTSHISGFSFLAFRFLPNRKQGKKPVYLSLDPIENLLDWSNNEIFDLVIPQEEDYTTIPYNATTPENNFQDFKKNKLLEVPEHQSGEVIEFYQAACKKLFNNHFPVTLLEIPQGLFLTPYTGTPKADVTTKALFKRQGVGKQTFVYNTAKGKLVRSVEEIWNTQMWFQQFRKTGNNIVTAGDPYDPALRPAGYTGDTCLNEKGEVIDCPPKPDCPDPKYVETYLPNFLDKQELTYIASLGRENSKNNSEDWNIHTKGLVFTGLGAITKMHYKNLQPPRGTSLSEYEHHITLGRDEYIKVARLGVISVTGQRALHVKIGERKTVNGTSYMQFKEYIEIVEKDKVYYDEKLFIKKNPEREPENYIQARTYPVTAAVKDIIHSKDLITEKKDNTWRDELIWKLKTSGNIPYLPGHPYKDETKNWITHYRNWPFKKIVSVTLQSPPINSTLPEAIALPPAAACNCAEAFWPVSEKKQDDAYKDIYFDFKGYDWNDQEIKFSSTFLFIRKEVIECSEAEVPKNLGTIYDKFIKASSSRRHIQFRQAKIAFTPDYIPEEGAKEELPNKSNVPKTDFVEYYFSICAEPIQETIETGAKVPVSSIFNERFFPLYPQVKRIQFYDDNIQSKSPQPLPSIGEISRDFVNYGFYKTIKPGEKGNTEEQVYNKARIVFNHTEKFMKGEETTLINNAEEIFPHGYSKIRNVFNNAGPAIGGLVNPDFDIEAIGLVKQSIAVAKNINEKYTRFSGSVITRFNPSDLLRQAPDIFNGISLIDILKEVFPEMEAPLNEIKNIAGQIAEIQDKLLKNEFYLRVKGKIDAVKIQIDAVLGEVEKLEKEINQKLESIRQLKDALNLKYQFAEIQNMVEAATAMYKSTFLEVREGVVRVINDAANNQKAIDFLATELVSRAESITPYWKIFRDAKKELDALKSFRLPDGRTFSAAAQAKLDAYIKNYLEGTKYILIDLSKEEAEMMRKLDDVKAMVIANTTGYLTSYKAYADALSLFKKAAKAYATTKTTQLYDAMLVAQYAYLNAKSNYDVLLKQIRERKELPARLVTTLRQGADAALVAAIEPALLRIQDKVVKANEILEGCDIHHFITLYEKAIADFETFKSKLDAGLYQAAGKDFIRDIHDLLQGNGIKNKILSLREDLQLHYQKKYDSLKDDIHKLVAESEVALNDYKQLVDNLPMQGVLALTSFPDIVKALRDQIEKQFLDVQDQIKKQLADQLKKYEDLIRKQVEDQAAGIVAGIANELKAIENQVLNDPDNAALRTLFVQGKELYNVLTALSKKEVKYTWKTTSFKNADFGMVAFLTSKSPRTSLSVNVVTTIHFQPSQFPAVIGKVDMIAENRVSNFGISLMKSLIVNFNEVSFIAGSDRKSKFDVKIRDVQFAGAFSFVQAFESYLRSMMGDAFRLKLQPTSVNIGYTLPIPAIKTPGFSFFNLTLNFDFWLHFTKKPMQLGFSLGRIDNKFGITCGVYAGFGFFSILAEPKKGLTEIEVGLEFGGYYGLSLGPMRGEVKLVVGLYYKKDASGVIIEGYFLCEGRMKLWIVMVSARFYMGVKSRGGYVEGRCSVTYEVRLGRFFKRSFTATYYKKLAGASPRNNDSSDMRKALAIYEKVNNSDVVEEYKKLLPQQKQDYVSPLKRSVLKLEKNEWKEFINSYID